MIKVNLLPGELRKKKVTPFFDRYFMYVFLAMVVGLVAIWLQTQTQQNEIEELSTEIARVESEIQRYSQQVKMVEQISQLRDRMTERINAIQILDVKRPLWVKTMENFADLIPEFVWITDFVEVEKVITVKGSSYNLKGIANFLVGLIKSEYFDNIQLNYIREQSGGGKLPQYDFELSGDLIDKSAEKYAGVFLEQEREEEAPPDQVAPKPAPVLEPKGREALAEEKDEVMDAAKSIETMKPAPKPEETPEGGE